jgi:predicted O-methyltransferase YrrM
VRAILNVISRGLLGRKLLDDFQWSSYTQDDYRVQLLNIIGANNLVLENLDISGVVPTQSNLSFPKGVYSLYQAIAEQGPGSIFEVGAGAGYNLINLHQIIPGLEVKGCELLQSQVDLGLEIFGQNSVLESIEVVDFLESTFIPNSADVVFTNAVTMHLKRTKAKEMIKKMIQLSNKTVLLHENIVDSHKYASIISEIKEEMEIDFQIKGIFGTHGGIIQIRKIF